MSKTKPFDNIDWKQVAELGLPIIAPFVQGALWYGFVNLDKRAQALSRFIAIAEVVPAVDLNLPRGVVLASMFDSVEEAIEIYDKIIESIQDLPDSIRDLLQDIKEELPKKEDIIDPILDPAKETSHEFQKAFADCVANAQQNLGKGIQFNILGGPWIVSCMLQKGYSIQLDYVRKKLGL